MDPNTRVVCGSLATRNHLSFQSRGRVWDNSSSCSREEWTEHTPAFLWQRLSSQGHKGQGIRPKVPRPPATAASRTPRPGLLVQQQLRLLGSSRHLSLCGKTRPFRGLGASLGRSSPGPSAAGRVPPQLLPPPSVPPPPQPGRPKRGRGRG